VCGVRVCVCACVRCRYTQPAKPRELLRLSKAHSARAHLNGLEAGLRQHRKLETKELCVRALVSCLPASMHTCVNCRCCCCEEEEEEEAEEEEVR
jgi:hypothetical protein